MSVKSTFIKMAIKMTPNFLIVWVANIVLKGIAELLRFDFDVDTRKLYVQTRLYGEESTIDVMLEDFAVFNDGDGYRVIIYHASSDRPWLNNLLAKVIGKAWKIPAIPEFSAQLDLIAELFKAKPAGLPNENPLD